MITNELYDLAHAGNVAGVRKHLDATPLDLNEPTGDGYTALHVACMFGHLALVEFLVDHGALINIEAMNESRATPLHLAVCFRLDDVAVRVARVLVDHGAELNGRQSGGLSALHHAVMRGSYPLVKFLIEAGADPYLKDEQKRTPVDLAKSLPAVADQTDSPEALVARIREELKRAHLAPATE